MEVEAGAAGGVRQGDQVGGGMVCGVRGCGLVAELGMRVAV